MSGPDFSLEAFATAGDRSARMVAAVVDRLPSDTSVRILDIGCGDGATALALAERLPFAHCVGIEPSGPSIENARRSLAMAPPGLAERVTFRQSTLEAFVPDAPFDAIVMDSVLHLIPGPTAPLARRLSGLLVPDGVLVHNTPSDSGRNRAVLAVRRILAALRGPALDRLALAVARRLHGRDWSETALRERLVYLYVIPPRLYDEHLKRALAHAGLEAVRDWRISPASPAQLAHCLCVWRKTGETT
jgi:trans-aconitate methyltransferase